MICSTWRTSSKKLKSHQDGYGPTMVQLSNIVEFRTLEKTKITHTHFTFSRSIMLQILMGSIITVQAAFVT